MTSRNNECRLGRVIRLHDSQTISCQFLFQIKICWEISYYVSSVNMGFPRWLNLLTCYSDNSVIATTAVAVKFPGPVPIWERRFTSHVTYSGLFTMIYIGEIVCFETNIKNKLSDQSLTTETHFERLSDCLIL